SATMAEELALEERLGYRRAVHAHEVALRSTAQLVDTGGDELLAGAAFAADEDRGIARRDLRDELAHATHRRGAADDLASTAEVADLGAQIGELGSKLAVLEGSLDESDEALGIDRLLDEIIGAVLHRLHGVLDRSHSREEDDGSAGASIGELLEQTEPIEARKVEVGDDDGEALAIDEAKRILRRWRAADGEPFARQ